MDPTPTPSPDTSASKLASSRWSLPLFLLCLVLFLAFGLEIAARIVVAAGGDPVLQRVVREYNRLATDDTDWIRFVADPELSYRLRPGFTLKSADGSGVTHHNADGFRDTDDFPPKSKDVLRIACFGASTTYGVSVADNSETYPAQLEMLLNGEFKPAGWVSVEVFNLGVGGYTSREILGTMKRMLPKLQPDVVLIQNAINDVAPRFYPNYDENYRHFRTNFTPIEVTPLRHLAYRSQAWITLAYGLGWIKPLSLQSQTQQPLPPVDEALTNLELNRPTGYEKNLTEMVATAKAAGCQVWLMTQAYLDAPAFAGPNEESRRLEAGFRRGLAEHTKFIATLAEKAGVGLIELDKSMPGDQWLYADSIHMTAKGNVIKAKLVAKAIVPTLPTPKP